MTRWTKIEGEAAQRLIELLDQTADLGAMFHHDSRDLVAVYPHHWRGRSRGGRQRDVGGPRRPWYRYTGGNDRRRRSLDEYERPMTNQTDEQSKEKKQVFNFAVEVNRLFDVAKDLPVVHFASKAVFGVESWLEGRISPKVDPGQRDSRKAMDEAHRKLHKQPQVQEPIKHQAFVAERHEDAVPHVHELEAHTLEQGGIGTEFHSLQKGLLYIDTQLAEAEATQGTTHLLQAINRATQVATMYQILDEKMTQTMMRSLATARQGQVPPNFHQRFHQALEP